MSTDDSQWSPYHGFSLSLSISLEFNHQHTRKYKKKKTSRANIVIFVHLVGFPALFFPIYSCQKIDVLYANNVQSWIIIYMYILHFFSFFFFSFFLLGMVTYGLCLVSLFSLVCGLSVPSCLCVCLYQCWLSCCWKRITGHFHKGESEKCRRIGTYVYQSCT